jgi:cytochrome P450
MRLVDEVFRLDPPVHVTSRECIKETVLGGCRIPLGSTVLVNLAAANRDVRGFGPDAGQLNPSRTNGSPNIPRFGLSFGHGMDRCLGTELARLELDCFAETDLAAFGRADRMTGAERFYDGTFGGFTHYFVGEL